jgi:probable phosphoglycerate mutase
VSGELWIARHGETAWSRTGRHTGRTDVPLTAAGRREARALGRVLRRRHFALVLSSPLVRAWETCRLAGFAAEAARSDDLLEWDYGALEGRTASEVQAERPGWTIWDETVPLGESLDEVAVRARRVIARSATADGDVLLFAHGHLLRILSACWLGLPPRDARLFALATASLGVLGDDAAGPVLRAWNLGAATSSGAARAPRSRGRTGAAGRGRRRAAT